MSAHARLAHEIRERFPARTSVIYVVEADLFVIETTNAHGRWRVRLDATEAERLGAEEVAKRLLSERPNLPRVNKAWISRLGDA